MNFEKTWEKIQELSREFHKDERWEDSNLVLQNPGTSYFWIRFKSKGGEVMFNNGEFFGLCVSSGHDELSYDFDKKEMIADPEKVFKQAYEFFESRLGGKKDLTKVDVSDRVRESLIFKEMRNE